MIWANLHAHNISVLWLTDKFSDNSKISKRALGIGDSHHSVHTIFPWPTLWGEKRYGFPAISSEQTVLKGLHKEALTNLQNRLEKREVKKENGDPRQFQAPSI